MQSITPPFDDADLAKTPIYSLYGETSNPAKKKTSRFIGSFLAYS